MKEKKRNTIRKMEQTVRLLMEWIFMIPKRKGDQEKTILVNIGSGIIVMKIM